MMNTQDSHSLTDDYQRIATAIEFVAANFRRQPSLDEIAAIVHLSKYHFHRLFKRWAGITPTQFMHYLTVEYAKERLNGARSVFDVALDAGLSGSGRLHDLFITHEAMTPGDYKRQAAGLTVRYGFHETPFGNCLIATTERGICALRFVGDRGDQTLAEVQAEWPLATWVEAKEVTEPLVQRIFGHSRGGEPIHLLLRGTNFQIQVWRALLTIPEGSLVSYGDVAVGLDRPTASRAVAGAVARNPIGYLIPCHRVISKAGKSHRYRWGTTRKQALIAYEAGRANAVS